MRVPSRALSLTVLLGYASTLASAFLPPFPVELSPARPAGGTRAAVRSGPRLGGAAGTALRGIGPQSRRTTILSGMKMIGSARDGERSLLPVLGRHAVVRQYVGMLSVDP